MVVVVVFQSRQRGNRNSYDCLEKAVLLILSLFQSRQRGNSNSYKKYQLIPIEKGTVSIPATRE